MAVVVWPHNSLSPSPLIFDGIEQFVRICSNNSVYPLCVAPTEESVLKVTHPFREIGIAHAAPALTLEDALKMMEKM